MNFGILTKQWVSPVSAHVVGPFFYSPERGEQSVGANQERILLPLRTNPLASLLHGWVDGKKAERGERGRKRGGEGRKEETV